MVLAAVAFVHIAWALIGDAAVAYGNLVDSDGYARLLRIERLLETSAWFDVGLPRANWPDGGTLHWTRPLDILIIIWAFLLAPIIGFSNMLFWGGVLIGPLLHGLAAVAVMWAARPLIGATGAVIAGLLAAISFGVLGYATIGHADHHVLVGLVAVVAFGFTVRAVLDIESGERQALYAGLTLAFGIWVGTEIQVTAALCLGLMGLAWAVEGEAWVPRNRRLALGLLAGLVVAVVIERGPGFFDTQYDRISFVHVSVAALIAAFWEMVRVLEGRLGSIVSRFAAGIAGDVVIVAVMAALFPKVLISPLKDADPVLLKIFDGVAEYAPMADAPHFLVYAGAVLIALPWTAWRLKEP